MPKTADRGGQARRRCGRHPVLRPVAALRQQRAGAEDHIFRAEDAREDLQEKVDLSRAIERQRQQDADHAHADRGGGTALLACDERHEGERGDGETQRAHRQFLISY